MCLSDCCAVCLNTNVFIFFYPFLFFFTSAMYWIRTNGPVKVNCLAGSPIRPLWQHRKYLFFDDRGGIRTHGPFRASGFQDQRTRPTMRPCQINFIILIQNYNFCIYIYIYNGIGRVRFEPTNPKEQFYRLHALATCIPAARGCGRT